MIQETKKNAEEATKLGKSLWHASDAIFEDSRGASRGLCTLQNNNEVCLEIFFQNSTLDSHQIQVQAKQQIFCGYQCVYANQSCGEILLMEIHIQFKRLEILCGLHRGWRLQCHQKQCRKTKGGVDRDPFNEKTDLIEDWDMIDVTPQRGLTFVQSQAILFPAQIISLSIATSFAKTLPLNPLFSLPLFFIINPFLFIIHIQDLPNYGPLPFRFDPL